MTEEEQKQRWAAVREVERLMRTREASLAANHDRALRKAEEYHSSAESRLQDELRTLKVRKAHLDPPAEHQKIL